MAKLRLQIILAIACLGLLLSCGGTAKGTSISLNEDYDSSKLKELEIYKDISKQPARVKCATIGINGIKDILEKN